MSGQELPIAAPFACPGDRAVDVSVILVNFNTGHLLEQCIADLRAASQGLRVQVVIVDNGSRDESAALIRERLADCQLVESGGNIGFGRANNLALPHCSGRHLLLLNTDAFVAENALREAVRALDGHADWGIVGLRLVGTDGEQQHSCRAFPTPLNLFLNQTGLARLLPGVRGVDDPDWDPSELRECDWVPGCFLLVRREVVEQVGLFDHRYFLYCEEVDFCRAVKQAGWKVMYLPSATVVHIGGESAKSVGPITAAGRQISGLQVESELLYFRKHHGLAGACGWLLLSTLAALIVSVKSALRGRGLGAMGLPWRQAAAIWRGGLQTRVGARPTR